MIKTLINHQMETGLRKDSNGNPIPRQIINRFVAEFNGQTVIDVALEPAVSTNPYFEFEAVVPARLEPCHLVAGGGIADQAETRGAEPMKHREGAVEIPPLRGEGLELLKFAGVDVLGLGHHSVSFRSPRQNPRG